MPASIAVSLLLLAPGLASPRYVDDFYLHARVGGRLGEPTVLRAYEFFPTAGDVDRAIESGLLPWWTDPSLRMAFFRPLTSATHSLDVALFDGAPIPSRLHSWLWLCALLAGAWALLSRWLAPRAAALAMLAYATASHHALSSVWLAARHALVAGAFGAFAVWAWLRFREDGSKPHAALWLALSLLALCGSEVGLGALVLCASHALFADRDRRFVALPLGLAAVYLALYTTLGYGVEGSPEYVEPLSSPLAFVQAASTRSLALAAQLLLGIPANFYIVNAARPVLFVAGALGIGLVGLALWKIDLAALRARPGWLLAGSAAALVPATAAVPGGRALALSAIACTAVVAALLFEGARTRRAIVVVAILGFGQLVVSPAGRVLLAKGMADGAEKEAEIARRWRAPCGKDELRVIVSARDFAVGVYAPLQLSLGRGEPLHQFRLVSMAPFDMTLERSGSRELRLQAPDGSAFFQTLWETVHGAPRDEGRQSGIAVRREGDRTLVITTDAPVDAICWLAWKGGTLERVEPPPAGQRLLIPTEPGPLDIPGT